MNRAKSVDQYIQQSAQWRDELDTLRNVLTSTKLREEVKWGAPCYTYDGKNIVGVGAFKSYFGLWFHQGALLADTEKVLINAQAGKTKALRQWRMTSASEIKPAIIKRYVKESINNVDSGRSIRSNRGRAVEIPAELQNGMRRHSGATAAFKNLRAGLQREYADYISDAKRAATRQRRIRKILPMICEGIGLNDKYRGS